MAVLNSWQKPSRVISTDFGNGSDGSLTISGDTTEAPIDSSCSGTSGATSLSATNASFATGQIILIHQTRGTGVGQWEINRILSYVAGTITTQVALNYTYTDSGASQAQVRVLKQYTDVTIDNTKTYTSKAWDGDVGGIIGWLANGTTTVTGTVTASSKGFLGGDQVSGVDADGKQGEGTAGAGDTTSTAANGNGGGGPDSTGLDGGGGGGGGGHAAAGTTGPIGQAGTAGTGGSAVGSADLITMIFGGAGGSGSAGRNGSNIGYAGGIGAGIVTIYSKTLTVTGAITNAGGNGNNAVTDHGGGGGAGAGGAILLVANTSVLGTNLVTAAAGTGGTAGSTNGNNRAGGNGSVGRIAVHYKLSVTGTTSPTYDSTQEPTLITDIGGSFLYNFI